MVDEQALFSQTKKAVEDNPSESNLLAQYEHLKSFGQFEFEGMNRLLAEICYLLAWSEMKNGQSETAKRYANESIGLYGKIRTDTQQQACPLLFVPGMPDFMHEGVVKHQVLDRLGQ